MQSQVQIELLLFNAVKDTLAPHKPITADTNALVHAVVTRLVDEGVIEPAKPDEESVRRLTSYLEELLQSQQTAIRNVNPRDSAAMSAAWQAVVYFRKKEYSAELNLQGQLFVRHPTV